MNIKFDKLKKTDYPKLSPAEIEADLTEMQRRVTRENGTEPPFRNEYHDNHKAGLYVDLYTGEVLFTSLDKFDSGCGWPSFAKAFDQSMVKELKDSSHGMLRTEVRSAVSNAHLGHVFNDGPRDKGGLRYCINSAAVRFIAKEDMAELGYGEYLELFK